LFLKAVTKDKVPYSEIREINIGEYERYKTYRQTPMELLEMNKFIFDDNLRGIPQEQRGPLWDDWYYGHQTTFKNMVHMKQRAGKAIIQHDFIEKPKVGLKHRGLRIALINEMSHKAFGGLLGDKQWVTGKQMDIALQYIRDNEWDFRKVLTLADRDHLDFTAAMFKHICKEFFDVKVREAPWPISNKSSKEQFHKFFTFPHLEWQSTRETRAAYLKKFKTEHGKFFKVNIRKVPKPFWNVTGQEYQLFKTGQSSE